MIKKSKITFKTIDWKTLKKGDCIKVIGRCGPYIKIGDKKLRIGAPPGNYCVQTIDKDGIHAYQGINHFFIYMGPEKVSDISIRLPHKIKQIISKSKIYC